VPTYFVYDELGHLIGEYNGSGGLIQETVWMDGIPVATLRPNVSGVTIFYVHSDHLNTPRRVSRSNDNVIVWRWDSDPFGTTSAIEDPDGDTIPFSYNLRFAGQYFDSETGLHHNYFRDYDAVTGAYIESDPIGLAGSLNTYAYVTGNPVQFSDRFGLDSDDTDGTPGFYVQPLFPAFTPGTPEYEHLNRLGNQFLDDLERAARGLLDGQLYNEEGKPDREQKPDDCPAGTKPVDQDKRLDREKIHKIKGKGGLNAGPKDWVGIDPNGNIWTNEGGHGTNNGHYTDYLN
jgi:RHS repeat-associated protein